MERLCFEYSENFRETTSESAALRGMMTVCHFFTEQSNETL